MWIFNRLDRPNMTKRNAQNSPRSAFANCSSGKLALLGAGLFAVLVTTGCQLPKPGQREDGSGGASFTVESISGSPQKEQLSGTFKLPVARVYNIKTCLKDFARSQPLSSQNFEIPEIELTTATDTGGCLNWSETVEFNDLAVPAFLQFERTLKAKGMARGERTIRFALSPWAHGEEASDVIDLSRNKVQDLVENAQDVQMRRLGRSTEESQNSSPIGLDAIQITASDERLKDNKLALTYEVRGEPHLILTKLNGEKHLRPLRVGLFHAQMQLILQDVPNGQDSTHGTTTETKIVLSKSELKNQALNRGALVLRFPVLTAVPNSGQLMVSLRLIPVDGPAGMKPFEGLYLLGDYRKIKSGGSPTLSPVAAQNPNFSISKYLGADSSSASDTASPTSNDSADSTTSTSDSGRAGSNENPGHLPGHLTDAKILVKHLAFAPTGGDRGSTLDQDFTYAVTACFTTTTVDPEPLRARKVKVTGFEAIQVIGQETSGSPSKPNGSNASVDLTTNTDGCATWHEKLRFKVYDCKRYLPRSVTLEIADQGWTEKIDYFVTPWPIGNGALAFDKRAVDPKNFNPNLRCDPANEAAMKGNIELDTFSYSTASYPFNIDHQLNLTIQKRIELQLAPSVTNYSNPDNGLANREALRDGPYLLKLLILRNPDYDSDNTYVSHATELVSLRGGRIQTSLEVSTRNLKSWRDRNRLYIELHPVSASKVKSLPDGRYAPLAPQAADLDAIIEQNSGLESPTFTGLITLGRDVDSAPLKRVDSSSQSKYIVGSSSQLSGVSPQPKGSVLSRLLKESLERKRTVAQNQTNPIDIEKWTAAANLLWITSSTPRSSNFLKAMAVSEAQYHSHRMSNWWTGNGGFWQPLRDQANAMTVPQFRQILSNGLTPELARQLCIAWTQELLGPALSPYYVLSFASRCKSIVENDPLAFFQVLSQTRVHKLDGSRLIRAYKRDFNVSHAFSVSRTHSESLFESKSLFAEAKASGKLPAFFGVGIAGAYTLSWNKAEDLSSSQGFSAREGVSLSIEESVYELDVASSETCATIRLNPDLFKVSSRNMIFDKLKQIVWAPAPMVSYLRSDLSDANKAEALSRGVMVCSGRADQRPIQLTEKYYLIYQDIGNTGSFDSGNMDNHFLFISMRGERDFTRFIRAVRGGADVGNGTQSDDADFTEFGLLLKQFYLPVPTVPGLIQNY